MKHVSGEKKADKKKFWKSFFGRPAASADGNRFLGFLKTFFYLAFSSFVLIWPSLWNGYPLVFSDTGSYIFSGFSLQVPYDRPIGYGLLIRFFSMHLSLWFVVYLQAFLMGYLLWKIVGIFFERNRYFVHFYLAVFLGSLTLLPWLVSQIMVDVFPSMIFLVIFTVVFGKIRKAEQLFLLCLMFLFLITHSANFLLSLGVLLVVSFFVFFNKNFVKKKKHYFRQIVYLGVVSLLAPLFFLASNSYQGYGFVLSPSSHVFMMSRLNESGILQDFLTKNCDTQHYFLCTYPGAFPQDDQFIWAKNSPVSLQGWDLSRPEYNEILRSVFLDPNYVWSFVKDSAYRSARLLFMAGSDNYYPYTQEDGAVYPDIFSFFPKEISSFTRTLQYQGFFQSMRGFALLDIFVVSFSLLLFLWMFFKNQLRFLERTFFFTVLFFLLINAVLMATLSGVYGRYQERLVWLLPFAVGIFVVRIFLDKYSKKN